MTKKADRRGSASKGALQSDEQSTAHQTAPSLRIDIWLWHARFLKTRGLAAIFVANGNIRLSRKRGDDQLEAPVRLDKAHALVRPGDVLSFVIGNAPRVIEVAAIGKRRGPATEAALLYNDQSPIPENLPNPKKRDHKAQPQTREAGMAREAGMGRPTKKDRRAIERLRGNS